MTPAEIELAARRRYNAVGDTNWSTSEFLEMMDDAQQQLAQEALIIEQVYTTTTVASQQQYDLPSSTIALKRVEYDGSKLTPIDMREDDQLSLNNSTTTATGRPEYYWVWNETLYLRSIPDDALSLKLFTYNEPQPLTSLSTLEVPSMFHHNIVGYLLSQMYAKDKDFIASKYYLDQWDMDVRKAAAWQKRRKRGDGFGYVKNEEGLSTTLVGMV